MSDIEEILSNPHKQVWAIAFWKNAPVAWLYPNMLVEHAEWHYPISGRGGIFESWQRQKPVDPIFDFAREG